MPTGVVKKIVRLGAVSIDSKETAGGSRPRSSDGYGIIHGHDGEDIFFVHSVVVGRFESLHQGQAVEYTLERSPLVRAETVVPTDF